MRSAHPSLFVLVGLLMLAHRMLPAQEVAQPQPGGMLHEVAADASRAYRSIGEALAHAGLGDVIRVHPGTYRGRLLHRNGISISGVDAQTCIVEWTDTADPVILVPEGAGGILEGLTFTARNRPGSQAAIAIFKASPIVRRCIVEHVAGYGIWVEGEGAAPMIIGNTLRHMGGSGIFVQNGAGGLFQENFCDDNA